MRLMRYAASVPTRFDQHLGPILVALWGMEKTGNMNADSVQTDQGEITGS